MIENRGRRARGGRVMVGCGLAASLVLGVAAVPAHAAEAVPAEASVVSADTPCGYQYRTFEAYGENEYQFGRFRVDVEALRDDCDKPSRLRVTVTANDLQYYWRNPLIGYLPVINKLNWWHNNSDVTLQADISVLRNGVNTVGHVTKVERHASEADGSLTDLQVSHEFELYGVAGDYTVDVTPLVRGMYWGGDPVKGRKSDLYPDTKRLTIAVGNIS
ncbi:MULTISPECIES: hypothetical protein [Bacteria]|uniref:hypothetical protein n=1 Tax=Bacteria TaxID=2 RepID=UPI003C7B5A65